MLFRRIRSLRIEIKILALLSLFVVTVTDLFLRKLPEIFEYGQEVGELIYRISLSVLASCIFYFVVVHLKAEDDKQNIRSYLADKVQRIYGAWAN